MDYVTRQFIVLTKKLRREIRKALESAHRSLENLTDSVKDLKNSVDAQQQADNKERERPIATVAELRTEIPIRVQTESDQSQAKRIWRRTKGTLEIAGILAVIAYTILANKQWHEMISARHQTQRAIDAAERSAKAAEASNDEAAEHFANDERPYVNLFLYPTPAGQQPTAENTGTLIAWIAPKNPSEGYISWSFHFKNFGKSPAIHLRTDYHIEIGPNAYEKWFWKEPTERAGSSLSPGEDQYLTAQSATMSLSDSGKYVGADHNIVLFGHIEYDGLDGRSYWTEFCMANLKTLAVQVCPTHNSMK